MVITWIVLLSFAFNFSYGVLLPIVPALNESGAGWAFTLFALFKVLCLAPAGLVSDKLGHARALALALAIQVAALVCITFWQQAPWIGRIFEGIALALGTVSAISFLRIVCPTPDAFTKAITRVLGAGGLASILGPLFGFWLLPLGATVPLVILIALNSALFLAHFLVARSPVQPAHETTETNTAAAPVAAIAAIVIGLAAAKALAVGWEPNLAWWANHDMQLGATASGLTFIVMGLGFTIGALKPLRHFLWLGLAGFALLELAIRGHHPLWWAASPVLGYWYGAYVTLAIARLGWNKPGTIGRFNSGWMLVTDFPMALVPVVVWEWRAPSPGIYRAGFGVTLALISIAGLWTLWRQRDWDYRAPIPKA